MSKKQLDASQRMTMRTAQIPDALEQWFRDTGVQCDHTMNRLACLFELLAETAAGIYSESGWDMDIRTQEAQDACRVLLRAAKIGRNSHRPAGSCAYNPGRLHEE